MRERIFFRALAALMALVLFFGCMPALAEGDDWTNILLLGCDSYTKNAHERTDSMIIVSVNAGSGQVKMTSLMRDTWIPVPGHSYSRKLTELCTVGGPELTMRAINESFGMNIEKYALIGMAGIAEVIDLVGGIEIDVTEEERRALNRGLFNLSSLSGMEKLEKCGKNVHLNGNQATAFARIRKIDSDFVRTERQRTVLLAMADKFKAGASPAALVNIITTLLSYVETNITLTEIVTLAQLGLEADLDEIQQFRIPADGTYESGMYQGFWSIRPNFQKNARLLNGFIYGTDDHQD